MGEPPAAGVPGWAAEETSGDRRGGGGRVKCGLGGGRSSTIPPPRQPTSVCTGPASGRAEAGPAGASARCDAGLGGGAAGEAAGERPSLRAACSPGCANGGRRSRSPRFGQLDEGKAELESREEPGLSLLDSFPGERQEQHPERSQPRRASSPASRARDCTGAGDLKPFQDGLFWAVLFAGHAMCGDRGDFPR